MRQELSKKLHKDFPLLYKEFPDFQIKDEWFDLIYNLSVKLEQIINNFSSNNCECYHPFFLHKNGKCHNLLNFHKSKDENCKCEEYISYRPRALTIKEKAGSLRFCMTKLTDEINEAICNAEKEKIG